MALRTYKIPKHVDDILQVFFWEADEAFLFIAIWIIAIMLGHSLSGMILGIYITRKFAASKGNYLAGRLAHMAFFYGILDLNKQFKNGGQVRRYYK